MLKRRTILLTLAAACIGNTSLAHAEPDTLRIGLIATYSGLYADYGRQFDDGIAVYLKEHGGKIAGKKVEIIKRDNEGPKPDLAKRLALELIVRDKVNFLAGLDFSPNAYAVASIATQAKIPTIVMNAASSGVTNSSPYIARVSFTVEQVTSPMVKYMLKNGIKSAYTVVADYAPGIDAEAEFVRTFKAGGGTIVGAVRTPMSNPDFSAYVQRIKDSHPQAVFFFFPSGQMPVSFLKVWKERGLDKAGVKLFATGEATDDSFLEATGDVALDLITSHHYSYAHPSPLNKRFIKEFVDEFGTALRPNYFAVAAYDGMAAIAAALEKTGGDTNGPKVMQALKGLKLESPRGPIEIDAATRDIVQTVYIRKTERVDGKLVNVEMNQFDRVKDPLKETHGVAH
jgi:branched-chain amino acid transport system substrate-binding protein